MNIHGSYKAALICLLAAVAASAQQQNVISMIGWQRAAPSVIAGLVIFFTAGIGVLIYINMRADRKAAGDVRAYSEKAYEEECRRRRLTKDEMKLLRELTGYMADVSRPNLIFDSVGIYERCVDAYVEKRRGAYRTLEGMEDEDEQLRFLRQKMEYNVLTSDQPLFSTRNITTGQKTSIFTMARYDEKPPRSAALLAQNTKVVHVGEFYFTVRVYDELRLRLNSFEHDELTIAFVRQGDAAYSVNARVMGVDPGQGTIRFFHTLELMRSQKRHYMRLEISTPLRFRVLQCADPDVRPTSEAHTARIMDISGGGLSFFSDEKLGVGDIISVTVTLPGEALSGIKAKVLAASEVEGKTSTRYRHHIEYTDIDPRQRERIVKFVFEKQRQMLQMR